MDERTLLSVRDLKTQFSSDEGVTRAVDGVSFDVTAGTTLGIVGETGCGKSVTARSILQIVEKPGRIVAGEIRLRRDEEWLDLTAMSSTGRDIRTIRGGEIGLVFQEPMSSFSPVHTVGNQLLEAVRLHGDFSKEEAGTRATELLEMVGVPEPARRMAAYPWQLSGGLLQRAMIAMALAGEPRLLILDEPTTALDVITQAHILDLVRELQARTGLAMILITHDLGVVAQMVDEVVVMYLGRVVERGPVQQIFQAPRHPYTQALLQSMPSRHTPTRHRLPAIAGSIPHPFNRPQGCPFHPRCRHAIPNVCSREAPAPREVAARHEISCHLDELVAASNGHGAPPAILDPGDTAENRREGLGQPMLQVRNLDKRFVGRSGTRGRASSAVHAVDNVTFDIRWGETFALVGESGSGKTTTARCILRAMQPDAGEVLYRVSAGDVVDLAKLSTKQLLPLRPEIQMIFQDPYSSLNPRMSVLDIVGEPLLLNGMKSRRARVERVEELLQLVGLRPEYLRRFPHAFSGGQRQRIGIARALAMSPRLIVADEPVSALDASVQAQILNLMIDIQDRLGLTYLFVSHDLSVVAHISDRIGVMYRGQLVELGDTNDVLSKPRHPYTAALLSAVPKPDPATRAPFAVPRAKRPPSTDENTGCRFERLCPHAISKCKVETPEWQQVGPDRRARCHRAAELDLMAR